MACYLTSFPVICGGVDPSHSGLLRLSKGNAGDLIRSGCAGMFGDHVFGSDAASPSCATHTFNSRFMRQWKVCSGCWCWWRLYWGLYCVTSWPSSPPPPTAATTTSSPPPFVWNGPIRHPAHSNPPPPSLEGPLMHEGTDWRVSSHKHKVGFLSTWPFSPRRDKDLPP